MLNNSITNGDNINWGNFFVFLKSHFHKIRKIVLSSILISFIYFFSSPNIYSSKISFYTNYEDSSSGSIFSTLIGQPMGGSSSALDFSISDFIQSERFLSSIVEKDYNIDGQQISLIDHWGDDYKRVLYFNPLKLVKTIDYMLMVNTNLTEFEKKSFFVQRQLGLSIEHTETRLSGLNTITISTKGELKLADEIIKNIYISVLDYSRNVVNVKAKEKKDFINNQLIAVKRDLNNSEDMMVKFLTENKNLSDSPNLVIQKTRIDRDISLYTQLYFTLSDQLELAKIDEKDSTSPIFLLDKEGISHFKQGLSLLQLIIVGIALSSFGAIFYFLFQDRKSLFL